MGKQSGGRRASQNYERITAKHEGKRRRERLGEAWFSRTASKKGVHDREQKRSHGERENVRKKGGAKGYSPLLRSSAGTAEWEREMAELEGGAVTGESMGRAQRARGNYQ